MTDKEVDESSFLLKAIGALVTAVIIGLTSWMAITLNDVSIRMAVLESQVTTLAQSDSKSAVQANSSEIRLLDSRVKRLEEWNQNLSTRLSTLESSTRDAK